MKKIKILRNMSIKGVHHVAGKVAEVSEEEAGLLVGIGKAVYDEGKAKAEKKVKK